METKKNNIPKSVPKPSAGVDKIKPLPKSKIAPLPPILPGTPLPRGAEPKASSPAGKEKMGGVKKPTKSPNRFRDAIFSWLLGLALVLLLVVLPIAFLAFKTGVLRVSLLDQYYNQPVPTRYVKANAITWNAFSDKITQKLTSQGMESEPPLLVKISEKEFTGLLAGVVNEGLRSGEFTAEAAQVAFTKENIELYFRLSWHNMINFDLLAKLEPMVQDDGTLTLRVIEAKIGDLSLPGSWVLRLVGYVFARDVGEWRIVLSNGYGIQKALLSDSEITLFIGPVLTE